MKINDGHEKIFLSSWQKFLFGRAELNNNFSIQAAGQARISINMRKCTIMDLGFFGCFFRMILGLLSHNLSIDRRGARREKVFELPLLQQESFLVTVGKNPKRFLTVW